MPERDPDPTRSPDPACPLCAAANARAAYEGRDALGGGRETYTYFTCTACGVDFLHPLPDAAALAAFYPDDYTPFRAEPPKPAGALERAVLRARRGYRHLAAPAWARALAYLAPRRYRRQVAWQAGGRLLDVGCGGGKFLDAMRALGWTVAGLDADPRAVAACRARGLDVRAGDLAGDERSDASGYDCVTARHVLEHVDDPHDFIAGAARALRPGGLLHVRTPNVDALGRRAFGPHWYANDIPRHLVLFSPGALDTLLRRHGFVPVSLRTRSTPKVLLNSRDLRDGHAERPRRYRRGARLAARPAVWWSVLRGRGYEIVADYRQA